MRACIAFQEREAYAQELEELIPQTESLMTEKSALEDQLYQKQLDEEQLLKELESAKQAKETLERTLQSSQEKSQQVLSSALYDALPEGFSDSWFDKAFLTSSRTGTFKHP